MRRKKKTLGKLMQELAETKYPTVQNVNSANTVPTRYIPFCECSCSTIMHNGAKGTGPCLLHGNCTEYKERVS